MKIISLSYTDRSSDWTLNKIDFKNSTLLVGASGVGKTRILNLIVGLKKLIHQKEQIPNEFENAKWEIQVSINEVVYTWAGETKFNENNKFFPNEIEARVSNKNKESYFYFEKLTYQKNNGFPEIVFERTNQGLNFLGNINVPKVAVNKSLIDIFSEEELITPVFNGFEYIIDFSFDVERNYKVKLSTDLPKERVEFLNESSFEMIKSIDINIIEKLTIAYYYFKNIFDEIKKDFIDIFDFVQDVRMEPTKEDSNVLELQIEEENGKWIPNDRMSSGMLKTLYLISLHYLSSEGSIILIDEFENSLGINCIDIIAQNNGSESQYIITSHHPYVINKISMSHWKIVSRNRNQVVVKDAASYKLGKSKHEAFKQLLNLDAFTEGYDRQ